MLLLANDGRRAGDRWAEADMQEDIKSTPYQITEAPDGGILINLK
jgi:hypothetical protein